MSTPITDVWNFLTANTSDYLALVLGSAGRRVSHAVGSTVYVMPATRQRPASLTRWNTSMPQ